MKVKRAKKNTKQFGANTMNQKQMQIIQGGKSKTIVEDDVHGI